MPVTGPAMYKVGTEDRLSACYRASNVQGGYRGLAQCLLQGQPCTRWVQRIDSVPVTVPAMYKVGTDDWLSVCYRASNVQDGYRGLAQCLLQGQPCTRWVQRIGSVPVTGPAMYKMGTEDWLSACYGVSHVQGGYSGLAQCLLQCQPCIRWVQRIGSVPLTVPAMYKVVQRIGSVPVTGPAMYKVGTED